jgi:hypothetical protein
MVAWSARYKRKFLRVCNPDFSWNSYAWRLPDRIDVRQLPARISAVISHQIAASHFHAIPGDHT